MQIQAMSKCNRLLTVCTAMGLVLLSTHWLTACSTQARHVPTADLSGLSPDALLAVYFQNERARGAVRLSFNSLVQVEGENPNRLRGVAGYTHCGDMRVKLVGTVGITVLDYLSIDGKGRLLLDKLTPDGDAGTKEGLLDTLNVFTTALTGLCRQAAEFRVVSSDEVGINYAAKSTREGSLEFTLDRTQATLTRQLISTKRISAANIRYSDFDNVAGFWMPATISIQSQDSPVLIDLTINQWRLNSKLQEGFFSPGSIVSAE